MPIGPQTDPNVSARAQAIQCINELSINLRDLEKFQANLFRASQEISKMYASLVQKVAELNRVAAQYRGATPLLASAIQQMQQMNQSFNLQYLMLQENMQQEQRQFSLLSNIMKTKHDGAKNVINNVR